MKQHSYCAFGPTLAASANLMCKSTHIQKSRQSSRTLFESGEMAVTLPTAALSPPLRALGMSLHAKQLQLAGSTFPTGLLYLSQLLQTSSLSPVPNVRGITLAWDPLYPYWKIELFLGLKYYVNHFATVFVPRPAFEEGTSHHLTVSEQNDTTRFDQLSPGSHSRKYRHHFKLLDDCSLLFGHYVV